MTYKGYIGTVRYSEEDEVFHGKTEAINDLIMFEGTSVKELKSRSVKPLMIILKHARRWAGIRRNRLRALQRKDPL